MAFAHQSVAPIKYSNQSFGYSVVRLWSNHKRLPEAVLTAANLWHSEVFKQLAVMIAVMIRVAEGP